MAKPVGLLFLLELYYLYEYRSFRKLCVGSLIMLLKPYLPCIKNFKLLLALNSIVRPTILFRLLFFKDF